MKPTVVFASLALCALLPACSVTKLLDPYLVDVRQGNYVTQEMVAQLKPGLTKDQVRFILGTPLIADVFHADRWDYLYRFKPGRGEIQQRHVSVFFDQGKLVRVGGDVVAGAATGTESSDIQPSNVPKVIDIGAGGTAPTELKLDQQLATQPAKGEQSADLPAN